MASDRSQFNRALRKWDGLMQDGAVSLPHGEGSVAILCSDFAGLTDDGKLEKHAFEAEAYNIARLITESGRDSLVYPAFTLDDAAGVLANPQVSSVITIGNGNLTQAYAHRGDIFDWRFVSEQSTHLKTGRFIMRHCGQAIRELSVPLGTFAMTDHSNVHGAYNTYLPTVMNEAYEDSIKRLHPHRRLSYHAIKNTFIKIHFPKPEDEETETPEVT